MKNLANLSLVFILTQTSYASPSLGATTSSRGSVSTLNSLLNQTTKINQQLGPVNCVTNAKAPAPSCEVTLDQFCTDLYAPQNPMKAGNIDLKVGDKQVQIRKGLDPKEFHYTFIALSKAKIENQKYYPERFRKLLQTNDYYNKLQQFLKRPGIDSLEIKRKSRKLGDASSAAWNQAFEDAVDEEMNTRHPNFLATKVWPQRWLLEYEKIKTKLKMDINLATWEHSAAWKKVESDFTEVRKGFLEEIANDPGIPNEYKKIWSERISSVQLRVPESTEDMIRGFPGCAGTTENAYYEASRNFFTVCAGDFNSEELLFTISHELGHSIGESRNVNSAVNQAPITPAFQSLTRELCEKQPSGCSETWKKIKTDLSGEQKLLSPLKAYHSETPNLRTCLQYKAPIVKDDAANIMIKQLAAGRSRYWRSQLAENHFFLSAIKPTAEASDGSEQANLGYLSPCQGRPWKADSFSIRNALPSFFMAEYQCNQNPDPQKKLAESIQAAELAQTKINEKTMPLGGPYASDSALVSSGISNDSEERFADWIGSRVFAQVLKDRGMSAESNRNEVSANFANFCDPPSNVDKYKDEAQTEKTFDDEPHSLNSTRRRELLSPPLCEILGCGSNPQAQKKECKI